VIAARPDVLKALNQLQRLFNGVAALNVLFPFERNNHALCPRDAKDEFQDES